MNATTIISSMGARAIRSRIARASGIAAVAALAAGLVLGAASGATAAPLPSPTVTTLSASPDGVLTDGQTVTLAATVGSLPTFTQVSSGLDHTLALDRAGQAYSWGANAHGQLGDGSTESAAIPTLIENGAVPEGVTLSHVAAGRSHSAALGSDGWVYTWGNAASGRLGNGTTTGTSTTPVAILQGAIPVGVTLTGVTAGAFDTFAVGSDGGLYGWGLNGTGRLGTGTTEGSSVPVRVAQGALPVGVTFLAVSAGDNATVALASDGHAYAWGDATGGALGNGMLAGAMLAPVAVQQGGMPPGVTIVAVSAGDAHTIVLGTDGRAYAWGANSYGALGNGTMTTSAYALPVSSGALPAGVSYVAVSAGASHSMALGSDGRAYAWGNGAYGQLGDGSASTSNVPIAVGGSMPPLTGISAGGYAGAAVAGDGTTYEWGTRGATESAGVQRTPVQLTGPITAAVSSGTVTFTDSISGTARQLGTPTVSQNGSASVTLSLATGRHSIVAHFDGTTGAAASASAPLSVTVSAAIMPTTAAPTPAATGAMPTSGGLAATGFGIAGILTLAAAVLAAGVFAVLTRRRMLAGSTGASRALPASARAPRICRRRRGTMPTLLIAGLLASSGLTFAPSPSAQADSPCDNGFTTEGTTCVRTFSPSSNLTQWQVPDAVDGQDIIVTIAGGDGYAEDLGGLGGQFSFSTQVAAGDVMTLAVGAGGLDGTGGAGGLNPSGTAIGRGGNGAPVQVYAGSADDPQGGGGAGSFFFNGPVLVAAAGGGGGAASIVNTAGGVGGTNGADDGLGGAGGDAVGNGGGGGGNADGTGAGNPGVFNGDQNSGDAGGTGQSYQNGGAGGGNTGTNTGTPTPAFGGISGAGGGYGGGSSSTHTGGGGGGGGFLIGGLTGTTAAKSSSTDGYITVAYPLPQSVECPTGFALIGSLCQDTWSHTTDLSSEQWTVPQEFDQYAFTVTIAGGAGGFLTGYGDALPAQGSVGGGFSFTHALTGGEVVTSAVGWAGTPTVAGAGGVDPFGVVVGAGGPSSESVGAGAGGTFVFVNGELLAAAGGGGGGDGSGPPVATAPPGVGGNAGNSDGLGGAGASVIPDSGDQSSTGGNSDGTGLGNGGTEHHGVSGSSWQEGGAGASGSRSSIGFGGGGGYGGGGTSPGGGSGGGGYSAPGFGTTPFTNPADGYVTISFDPNAGRMAIGCAPGFTLEGSNCAQTWGYPGNIWLPPANIENETLTMTVAGGSGWSGVNGGPGGPGGEFTFTVSAVPGSKYRFVPGWAGTATAGGLGGDDSMNGGAPGSDGGAGGGGAGSLIWFQYPLSTPEYPLAAAGGGGGGSVTSNGGVGGDGSGDGIGGPGAGGGGGDGRSGQGGNTVGGGDSGSSPDKHGAGQSWSDGGNGGSNSESNSGGGGGGYGGGGSGDNGGGGGGGGFLLTGVPMIATATNSGDGVNGFVTVSYPLPSTPW